MENLNNEKETMNIPEEVLAFRGVHLGLQFVADCMQKRKQKIDKKMICGIHRCCMANLLPEGAAGVFRTCDVGISRASITPPHWRDVPALMNEYIQAVNTKVNSCSHGTNCLPKMVETISFSHYIFARIHPFEDGNGRTVRLFCDYLAKKFDIRPIVVWPYEKDKYIESLEAVNRSGNLAHLELLLVNCLIGRYGEVDKTQSGILSELIRLREEKVQEIIRQRNKFSDQNVWDVFGQPVFN